MDVARILGLLAAAVILAQPVRAEAGPGLGIVDTPATRLACVTGQGQADLRERLAALRTFGQQLTPAQQRALHAFLLSPNRRGVASGGVRPSSSAKATADKPGAPLTRAEDQVLVNEIVKSLRLQEAPLPELTTVLAQLSANPREDPVVRSYAVQHLADWQARAPDQPEVSRALWAALNDKDPTVLGTTLLAGYRMLRAAPGLDGQPLDRAAVRLAAADTTAVSVRVPALQVCSQRKLTAILPTAVRLAQGAPNIVVRMAAIAAVGDLGGADAGPLLQRLATEKHSVAHVAAQAAWQRWQKRFNQTAPAQSVPSTQG